MFNDIIKPNDNSDDKLDDTRHGATKIPISTLCYTPDSNMMRCGPFGQKLIVVELRALDQPGLGKALISHLDSDGLHVTM